MITFSLSSFLTLNGKTNFGSRAFAVAGPMFWNRLPPEIRANDSLQSFKSQLKKYYF